MKNQTQDRAGNYIAQLSREDESYHHHSLSQRKRVWVSGGTAYVEHIPNTETRLEGRKALIFTESGRILTRWIKPIADVALRVESNAGNVSLSMGQRRLSDNCTIL